MSENLCLKEGQTSVGLVCLYYTVLSVLCSLVITCWETAYHLSLLCIMFPCVFVTFPYGVSGHVWYLIVAIPDLCNSTILIEHTVSKQWPCFVCQCPTKKPQGLYTCRFKKKFYEYFGRKGDNKYLIVYYSKKGQQLMPQHVYCISCSVAPF